MAALWFEKQQEPRAVEVTTGSTSERRLQARHSIPGKARLFYATPSRESRAQTAEIRDLSAEGISIRIPEPIDAGQPVEVVLGQTAHKAIVTYCKGLGKQYLAGLHFVTEERRRHDRLRTSGWGRLYWTDPRGATRMSVVSVQNASEDGLQIELPGAVQAPQFVRLCGQEMECLGWMLYCRPRKSKFVAGIELSRRPYSIDSADYRD